MSVPHLSKYPLVFLATLLTFFAALRPSASARTPAPPPLPKAATAQDAPPARTAVGQQSLQELRQAVAGDGKNDPEAWFRLGVAHNVAGDTNEARKAFKQAVKLRPGFAAARAGVAYTLFSEGKLKEAHKEAARATQLLWGKGKPSKQDNIAYFVYGVIDSEVRSRAASAELAKVERELSKKPDDPRWHLRKAYALLRVAPTGATLPPDLVPPERPSDPSPEERARQDARDAAYQKRYEEIAASFEKYLSLGPRGADSAFVRGQIEALRYYSQPAHARRDEKVFGTSEIGTKAVILSKPDPGFTEEARKNNVTGTVRLRAVLAADGTVKHILVVRPLEDGLSERAVHAARFIKFKPATVNGVPVSQYIILEYNFNIY